MREPHRSGYSVAMERLTLVSQERDRARRWARAWKRAAKEHRELAYEEQAESAMAMEIEQASIHQLAAAWAERDAARRWAKRWRRAASGNRHKYREASACWADAEAGAHRAYDSLLNVVGRQRSRAEVAEAERDRLQIEVERLRDLLTDIADIDEAYAESLRCDAGNPDGGNSCDCQHCQLMSRVGDIRAALARLDEMRP